MRKLSAVALAAVLALTLTGPVLAKGGPKGGNNSTSAAIVVADGVFAGRTTATTTPGLWVKADCYQGGKLVYEDYERADSAGLAVLPLGPTMLWTGGSANCIAQAGTDDGRFKPSATTTFSVSG